LNDDESALVRAPYLPNYPGLLGVMPVASVKIFPTVGQEEFFGLGAGLEPVAKRTLFNPSDHTPAFAKAARAAVKSSADSSAGLITRSSITPGLIVVTSTDMPG